MYRRMLTALAGCALVAIVTAAPAAATGGEGEAWPSFTESSSCGSQRVSTPLAIEPGWFGVETLLRGPFAEMFGRSVKELRNDLVRWEVPGSTEVLLAHERMQTALDMVDCCHRWQAGIRRGLHHPQQDDLFNSGAHDRRVRQNVAPHLWHGLRHQRRCQPLPGRQPAGHGPASLVDRGVSRRRVLLGRTVDRIQGCHALCVAGTRIQRYHRPPTPLYAGDDRHADSHEGNHGGRDSPAVGRNNSNGVGGCG